MSSELYDAGAADLLRHTKANQYVRFRMTLRTSAEGADVQADLGVDDDLLGGGHLVDRQGRVDGHVALDQRERDRAELVVAGARPDEADVTTVVRHRGAGGRQAVLRPVEVQQHQPAGRAPEGVHARDGL